MKNNLPLVRMEFLLKNFISNAAVKNLTVAFLFLQLFSLFSAKAQQTPQMTDYALFSGSGSGSGCTPPAAPGASVQVGCNSVVNGGAIGSLKFIQTTGSATVSGNLNSKGTIDLAANCIITGKVTASNNNITSGTAITAAGGTIIGGNIDVNGSTVISGGTISGKVTHPSGTTYTGPTPGGGEVIGTPSLTAFPSLPAITTFPGISVQADINTTRTISPGCYDDLELPGAKILTLNGPGVYVFDKVLNQSDNDLIFDFKNSATGVFKIYIHNDADFGQIHARFINGGSASRIFTEVHGNGSTSSNGTISFQISNCSGAIKSSWVGTVWAPYAAIKIGSLSGGTDITGALWSGTQVNVRCGVTLNAATYNPPVCTTPNANAGSDKVLTCSTTSLLLSGSSSTSGVTYSWAASNGGNIVSGGSTSTPIVNAAGTYTLTVTTTTGGCTATDIALVTSNTAVPNANAGSDKLITCSNNSVQLSGSSTTAGVTFSWVPSNGGNTTSGMNTATPIANAPGTYTLTVTNPSNGCKATDVAMITASYVAPNANAGADKVVTCSTSAIQLSGSSSSTGVAYSWVASNGGNIVSGATSATPTVNAAGTYTLTVSATNGCSATDVALVTGNTALPNANAGTDKALTCVTSSVQLNGSSSTSGVNFSWIATNGGNIVSGANTATPTVNAAGTYTLTVTTNAGSCVSTDAALVTFTGTLPNANAGADKQLNCTTTSVQLNGSSSTVNVTYNWVASNGGIISSGATTATPTVTAAGTYTLTVTKTSSGCINTDVAVVTQNSTSPNVNAGMDMQLSCDTPSIRLAGSSSTLNAQYSWVASATGNIISGANAINPLVNGAGNYTLTVTNPANGCTASDIASVSNGCILLYYPDDVLGKVDNKIGSELTSLFKNFNPNSADTTKNIFRLNHDSVWIEAIAISGQRVALASLLTSAPYGLTDTINNGGSLIITGKFPIKNLGKLDSISSTLLRYARPLYAPDVLSFGVAKSKGDSAMRADMARKGFTLTGNGIKVGLISDSYNTLKKESFDINNGDLPGVGNKYGDLTPVTILKECKFKSVDEGRAMAQIVYDVAPKAELVFRTGFNDANDFAIGIKQLQQQGCKVIVDDVTYITEPFFTDGVVARAVDNAAAAGVSYFSAAGNFGGKSYQSSFNPAATPVGLSGSAHNFSGGDILQKVAFKNQGDYTIVLQWEDGIYSEGGITETQNDLDIYITDNSGKILVGYNRNNIGGDPIEVLPVSIPTASAIANIMIVRAHGSANVKFKYVVFRGDVAIMEYRSDSSTIVGQANANGAIAVAAMRYNKSNTVEDFSSIGGTTVNGSVRNKPDITAPDGVNTTVEFGSTDIELDNKPNFFGTSAAAPHAAASAALILEARSKFYSQTIDAATMKTLLKTTAKDIGPIGFDFFTGSGLVQADAAIRTFATPKAVIENLVVPTGVTPGSQAFSVTINGKYLNNQSKVYLKGVQLPTVYVNSTQVSANIPVFAGNPPVTVLNPPTVPNANDGGFSDSLYFTPLKKVVITADNKTKKYGEKLPVFSVSVTVDNQPLASTSLTLAGLKLTNLVYTTSAKNTSDAVTTPYYIGVGFASPLNRLNPVDSILLSTYSYEFVDGELNINRLPITISSRDTTIVYGQKIDGQGLQYNYAYDVTNIDPADRANFLNSIEMEHESGIASAVALADERITSGVTGRVITNSDLINLSLAASDGAIANGRVITNTGVISNSSTFVDIAPQSIFDFLDHPDSVFLISGFAGQNPRSLMNGRVITNGVTGRVITNGVTGRVITNGVTGRVITNSTPGVNSNQKLALLVDSTDIFDTILHEIKGIKSINLITGTTVGTWRMAPAALLSDNFDISYNIGNLTITKATLTITADNKSRNYGSANPVLTASYSGFVNGDGPASITPPVISTTATSGSAAGSYLIKVNGGVASNYTLVKVYGSLTVKKVVVTATADNKSRIYGSANPVFTISYAGFVNGEGVDSLLTLPVASTLATPLSNVGTYSIKLTGGTARNYTITNVSGTLTVGKASLTAKADNKTKTYGSSNPAFTITYSGFLNSDGPSSISAPTASSSAVKLSGVGNYSISLSGGSSTNYTITTINGVLNIVPAILTVTADNKTINAGASLPSFTYSTLGFVTNGANTILSGPQYSLSPAYTGSIGTYSITPSALVLSQPANYNINYISGVLTVTTPSASAKKIEVELECVDTLINDASGFHYIARFEYENDNCYSVTIPIGADNSLTGNYSGTQPTTFLPGESHISIKFDGTPLTWTVKSYEGSTKKTSTASANFASKSCYCSSSRVIVNLTTNKDEEMAAQNLVLFPNPAIEKVYITSEVDFVADAQITVYDIVGKSHEVNMINNSSTKKIELDVRNLSKGIYFVKISTSDTQSILRFMKE